MVRPFGVSWRGWLTAVILAVGLIFVISWWLTAPPAEGRIADNIFIGNISLGGMTIPGASALLTERTRAMDEDGWRFFYQGQELVIDSPLFNEETLVDSSSDAAIDVP